MVRKRVVCPLFSEMTRRGTRPQRGFTLLELLMVVIIIGILASLAVPQYFLAMERARASSPFSFLGSLRSAEIRFRATHEDYRYTSNLEELDINLQEPTELIQDWGLAAIQLAEGPGPEGTPKPDAAGVAWFVRTSGAYVGQTVGLKFSSGGRCGTFSPEFEGKDVPCTPD